MSVHLRILEKPEEMAEVENLQRQVWTGSETEIVPTHMLIAAVHNGGLVIGAYESEFEAGGGQLLGFIYGFPGMYTTPDGPRLKHCSHMMGVLPAHRDRGLGFMLKRAQWQMVRHQGLDRITWTYDPMVSRNAYLNISKLGAVCNTYLRNVYGVLRDNLNRGLPTDRFQVDWWVNSQRVNHRLSRKVRRSLDLAQYFAAGAKVLNPSQMDPDGWAQPETGEIAENLSERASGEEFERVILVEVPADFQALRSDKPDLASAWRSGTRAIFEALFDKGFLVTDFIHLRSDPARSYYVLSHGDSTL